MTLIECFDGSVTENIVGCLHLRPQKLIFLGDEQKMREPVARYQAFLSERGMDVSVCPRHVQMDKMWGIVSVLTDIIRSEEKCVIDVTGGDERVLMAVGAMLVGLDEKQRKKVAVQKFDLVAGSAQDCDNDGHVIPGIPPKLTVRELVALHGGIVHPATDQPGEEYTPEDLAQLWELVCQDSKSWNRQLIILSEFESRADSKTQVFLPLDHIRGGIKKYEEKLSQMQALLKDFRERKVVRDFSNEQFLDYSYTSPLLRYCTAKAGNVLETKTLLEARSVQVHGKPYFDDCLMSVHIDWDGVVHDPEDRLPETRNEIDLILTRGLTPLFISCKNGDIGDDELYKLNTVAARFGGPSARKMLIATNLDRKSAPADRAFIQRARDMHIHLITDAAALSSEDWQDHFLAAME